MDEINGEKRCEFVTDTFEFDDDVEDDDESTIIDGTVADDNDEFDVMTSSARVPEPRRYFLPRHLMIDEPVKALK